MDPLDDENERYGVMDALGLGMEVDETKRIVAKLTSNSNNNISTYPHFLAPYRPTKPIETYSSWWLPSRGLSHLSSLDGRVVHHLHVSAHYYLVKKGIWIEIQMNGDM